MNIVMNLVLALLIVTALVMIGQVLLQKGKSADMGASLGSGASLKAAEFIAICDAAG